MRHQDNLFADTTKPLVSEIGLCDHCVRMITSNRLYTKNADGLFHLSCYNELKKDDSDGQ